MKTPFQVFFGDISSFALNNLLPLFNKNYSRKTKLTFYSLSKYKSDGDLHLCQFDMFTKTS